MTDVELSSLRPKLVAARAELVAAVAALPALVQRAASTAASLTKAEQQAAALRAQLEQLRATDPQSPLIPTLTEQLAAAEASVVRARTAAEKAKLALKAGEQRVAAARIALADLESRHHARAAAVLAALAPTLPLLLLPVRLETRFLPRPGGGGTDLLVRVYPDDVAEDGHQPALIATEVDAGTEFARQTGPGTPPAEMERAWIRLAERFGPGRAAWIARQVASGAQLTVGSPAAWARAPLARAIPDSWLFAGYRRSVDVSGRETLTRELLTRGAPIIDTLATGPSPETRRRVLPESGLEVDDGMRWMVDFEEAARVGMGVRIPLTSQQAQSGFDVLMAFGVRVSLDEVESAAELTTLLDAHHHTWGLGIVPQGTPTNNTDAGGAGHASRDADLAERFRMEHGKAVCATHGTADSCTPGAGSDGAALAAALGIDASVVAHVAHANRREQHAAGQMLDALWPATWAYFLEEMLHPAFLHFDDFHVELERWRAFAVRHVRARGPLPALRVGSQPYAILPVTSLDRWHTSAVLPEIIFFQIRNPPGDNVGQYRISWDVDENGNPGEWGNPINVPGWFGWENQGGAIAAVDLDDSGRVDLFVAHVDNPGGQNTGYYRVGQNLEARDPGSRGTAAGGWSTPIAIPGSFGAETRAMGIAVTRVPGRARPALVVHHVEHPDVRIVSGPEAVRSSVTSVLVFARAADGTLHQKGHDGTQWGNWERVDAEAIASDPAAVLSGGPLLERRTDRIDLFCRRAPDNAIWHRTVSGGRWTPWTSLGGTFTSGPAACSWAPGRLDVFARGVDDTLQHAWMEREWSRWESLGGAITSDPAAVSWGTGRIDVFARGIDNALHHRWFETATGWSGWESLGGVFTSGPAACSWGAGRLDVFGRGTDGAVYHKWFEGRWSDWIRVGGAPASDLSAVASGRGRIDVFASDTAGRLLHIESDAGRWGKWETLSDRQRAYYRVGWDVDAGGNVIGGWTPPIAVPGFFDRQIVGGGIAVADLSGNGTPDLIVYHQETTAPDVSSGVYRIGRDLSAVGQVSGWSAPFTVPWTVPGPTGGADVAVADLTGSGRPDMLVHYVEQRGADWFAVVRIGYDLDVNGVPASWSDALNAALAPLGPVAGVGIAVANIGRATGMLPTSATGFVNWLAALREPWRRSLPKVPRVGGASTLGEPPNQRLVGMLGMEPLSTAFAARSLLGSLFMGRLWNFLGEPLDSAWSTNHETLSAGGLGVLQLWENEVRLRGAAFTEHPVELYGPLVQAGTRSETDGLEAFEIDGRKLNYISWLIATDPKLIHQQPLPAELRDSLLYLLLRQALLWEYARAAYDVQPINPAPPIPPRDPEIVDMPISGDVVSGQTLTPWRQLLKSMGATHNNRPIVDYLHGLVRTNPAAPHAAGIARVMASLAYLAPLPTAALERLLCETLDLSTHRLDAWITSVATERLAWVRDTTAAVPGQPIRKPRGVALGGYGWVEDLRPAQARASSGYVHAPSLAQAATAAILRSGHLAHGGAAGDSPLAVDLSSGRVRLAVSLLEGMREGQPLGALLGYRFERGLHENHGALAMDKYVRRFRELAPVVARKLTPGKEPAEAVAAANVVDGLALVRRWQRGKRSSVWDATTIPFGGKEFPAITTTTSGTLTIAQKEYSALARELDLLEDALDAVADGVVAESVYQVVQGSPMRAGASLDAVSRGEAPVPELEVVRSPRTGIGLTHRVVTLFVGDVTVGDPFVNAWYPGTDAKRDRQVRAAAEPQLNAWAARLLGDPSRVQCRVEYTNSTTGVLTESPVTLKDLALSPLDVVYAAAEIGVAPRIGAGQGSVYFPARSEIEERVRLHAMTTLSGGAPVRLIYDRDTSWTPDDVSFSELMEVARRVRELVSGARALEGRDLVQPKDTLEAAVLDVVTLRNRADAAVNALDAANTALDLLAKQSSPDATALRAALLALAYLGVQGAIPGAVSGSADEIRTALKAQATGLVTDVTAQVQALRTAEQKFGDATSNRTNATALQQWEHDRGRLRGVFGNDFQVLPRFRPFGAVDLAASLNSSPALVGADPHAAVRWLQRAARVRAGAARLETTLLCAEATGGGDALALHVAQLPRQAGEKWVGLDGLVKGGRLSIVAHAPGQSGPFDATKWLSGLLVDEWVEVVPNATETTALTFHFDAPGSAAPQSMLLAVAPDVRRPWSADTLEAILLETLELAKLRLVDLDALGEVGHYLPGLYFAFNAAGDTISADFAATAGSPP